MTDVPFPLPRLQPRVLRQEVLGALRGAILAREIRRHILEVLEWLRKDGSGSS